MPNPRDQVVAQDYDASVQRIQAIAKNRGYTMDSATAAILAQDVMNEGAIAFDKIRVGIESGSYQDNNELIRAVNGGGLDATQVNQDYFGGSYIAPSSGTATGGDTTATTTDDEAPSDSPFEDASGPLGPQNVLSGATANSIVMALLRDYDLEFDQSFISDLVTLLVADPNNGPLVEQTIRDSTIFQDRFPGLAQRLDNGYNQISVDEYLALEDAYRNNYRNAGLPEGFYDDPSDFAGFISEDVSAQEHEQRIANGVIAAQTAPQEVKDALRNFYGVQNDIGALAAYYLDPEKGLDAIQREFEAASLGGIGTQVGFGVNRQQAERLQSLGVTNAQAREGFTSLALNDELFTKLIGEAGGVTFNKDQQLSAQFERNAEILDELDRQRRRRISRFQGRNAGAIQTAQGSVGLQE